MNNLPRSIEDMIYKNVEGMNRVELNKELEESFYICTNCEDLKCEKVNRIVLYCRYCDKTICNRCPVNESEYNRDICDICEYEEVYLFLIRNIMRKQVSYNIYLHISEEDRYYDIFVYESRDVKDKIIKNLEIIYENYDKIIKKQDLYDMIRNMRE